MGEREFVKGGRPSSRPRELRLPLGFSDPFFSQTCRIKRPKGGERNQRHKRRLTRARERRPKTESVASLPERSGERNRARREEATAKPKGKKGARQKKSPARRGGSKMVWVYLQFSGGLETLFDNIKSHKVDIPSTKTKNDPTDRTTVSKVIGYIQKKMLKKHPEMFLKGKELRPGILMLINDIDWELGGKEECIVENNDVVLFLSTLHGGERRERPSQPRAQQKKGLADFWSRATKTHNAASKMR